MLLLKKLIFLIGWCHLLFDTLYFKTTKNNFILLILFIAHCKNVQPDAFVNFLETLILTDDEEQDDSSDSSLMLFDHETYNNSRKKEKECKLLHIKLNYTL